jgi:protein-disulfide isomerase
MMKKSLAANTTALAIILLLTAAAASAASVATAQSTSPKATAASSSVSIEDALRPPPGHRLAIIVWEDLECPACAHADSTLLQAQHDYSIALVRHDFIIPNHHWSREAHIIARYFDSISPALGEQFRQFIFKNQTSIYAKQQLRGIADRFASDHHTALPAFYDSNSALAARVEADTKLGNALGINQTPTVYIVTDVPQKLPPLKLENINMLFQTIDDIKSKLPPAPKTAANNAVKKRATAK